MPTSRISLILISICTFSLFNTNYATSQAECLKKVIWSPRKESNSRFEASLMVDLDPMAIDIDQSEVITPKFAKSEQKIRKANRIKALPGQPKVDFAQHSGYVNLNTKNESELFYYFVESSQNASTKPLILWLNGGPGCSSLGYGAFQEIGPFRVNRDGKTLSRNKYAWNNVANILFLESPTSVGFSKTKYTGAYDDIRTAQESYIFLLKWLERFPEYKNHDFFITGESYAGHYIPDLADVILRKNKVANGTFINLKAVAIGNPFIDQFETQRALMEFFWHHGFLSDETYKPIKKNCDSSDTLPACEEAIYKANFQWFEYIDEYNIYAPRCVNNTYDPEADIDPCINSYVTKYLNDVAVKKAFHADLNIRWESCRKGLEYPVGPDTVLKIKQLVNKGLPVWLYSGDMDSMVPTIATKNSVKAMRLPVKTTWRPWLSNGQVGGFFEEYKGLTLATVRGAGHPVPSNQPHRALDLISYFLQGKSLPVVPQKDNIEN